MATFKELSVPAKMSIVLLSLKFNYRIVFGRKVWFFVAGVLIYFAAACIVLNRMEASTLEDALLWLAWLPTTVVTAFLSMDLVENERNSGVLETLFTTSVSRHRVWLIKFVVLMLFSCLLGLLMIVVTYLFAVDLPILLTWIYTVPQLVFIASWTVLFSVIFKSGNIAGLWTAAFLLFEMLIRRAGAHRVTYLFHNPFDKPVDIEPFIWARTVFYNKVFYAAFGCVCFWIALWLIDRRERLLE
jgi:ABC-type transport system involved in multi-copper enzyme maturation permease subunit